MAVSWMDQNGKFWLFGGISFLNFGTWLNDLWEYDPATGNWTWVNGSDFGGSVLGVYGTKGTPAAGNIPGARDGAISWTDSSGNLWLFGGSYYNGSGDPTVIFLNDLWRYQPAPETSSP
jgi:N-acetylneuraminic acid mutarotase